MRTNFRGSVLATTILVGCGALGVVGCGKPGNSEPSFRLNVQNQDSDDYRLVGYEDEAAKKDKEMNIEGRKYVVDALEAMFGTPDRPYVFPESGLDLAMIFIASGPVDGLPQSEIDAQIMKFRQIELEERPKVPPLEVAAKAADAELTKQQEPTKPIQARLITARKALADAETAKNEAAIAAQKAQIASIQAELKPFEEPIARATEAKAKADAELGKVNALIADVMRQIGVWQKRQLGLYRRHCSHCHGTSGDGAGPTALFLTPFPRDYRQGIFKFKSTERAAKPSHADLRRILVDGIPDSAMPTVGLLPDAEIDALVEYVKYLSMRGEVESMLRAQWMDDRARMAPSRSELIKVALQPVVDTWKEAEGLVVKPGAEYKAAYAAWKEKTEKDRAEQAAKAAAEHAAAEKAAGRTPPADQVAKPGEAEKPHVSFDDWLVEASLLFGGQKGQCYTCHGTTGLGDGRKRSEPLFDDWNKPKKFREFEPSLAAIRENIDTTEDDEALSDDDKAKRVADLNRQITRLTNIHNSWQLPEQQQFARNLRLGRFRFGRAPLDIYRRIHAGITGTEMPGSGPAGPGQQAKLTPTEIWQLVDYVLLLPYLDPTGRLAPSAERHAPATPHASHGATPAAADGLASAEEQ